MLRWRPVQLCGIHDEGFATLSGTVLQLLWNISSGRYVCMYHGSSRGEKNLRVPRGRPFRISIFLGVTVSMPPGAGCIHPMATKKVVVRVVKAIPPPALPHTAVHTCPGSSRLHAKHLFFCLRQHVAAANFGAIYIRGGNVQVLWFSGGGGVGGTSPVIWRVTFPM